MSEQAKFGYAKESPLKVVKCRRTGREFDCETHARCPYCFGDEKDVATGDHAEFCDYHPSRDPVSFGFPDDSQRLKRG